MLFDADKLDAIGAIGVARALAYAVLDGQPLYAAPSQTFIETLKTEPGEAYTAYHEHLFKLSKIKERMQTKSGQADGRRAPQFHAVLFRSADRRGGRPQVRKPCETPSKSHDQTTQNPLCTRAP